MPEKENFIFIWRPCIFPLVLAVGPPQGLLHYLQPENKTIKLKGIAICESTVLYNVVVSNRDS